mgnify:CR=1 FL=1
MSALATTYQHVFSIIQADTELVDLVGTRCYQGAAPPNVKYPLVLVQSYGDTEHIYFNGPLRAMSKSVVSIRVVAPDTFAAVENVSDRLDNLLNATGPTNYSRGHLASCVVVSETELTEINDGVVWRYSGGLYEVHTSPLS